MKPHGHKPSGSAWSAHLMRYCILGATIMGSCFYSTYLLLFVASSQMIWRSRLISHIYEILLQIPQGTISYRFRDIHGIMGSKIWSYNGYNQFTERKTRPLLTINGECVFCQALQLLTPITRRCRRRWPRMQMLNLTAFEAISYYISPNPTS